MAETDYPRNFSAFTGLIAPYTVPDTSSLAQEISDSAIITALSFISTNDNVCDIWFKAALSTGDEAILDALVAAHTGEPLIDLTPMQVRVVENNLLDPATSLTITGGHHTVIKAGQSITEHTITYPYEIDVVAARYFVPSDDANVKDGDRFDVIGIPGGDPFVGYVTADTAQDETVIPVSNTVFEYLRHGLDFKFDSHDTLYNIVSVDTVAKTLTLSTGLTQAVSVGDLIRIRRFMCRDLHPVKGVVSTIGDLSTGSAGLCANAKMIIRYTPETVPAADFTVSFEWIYSY